MRFPTLSSRGLVVSTFAVLLAACASAPPPSMRTTADAADTPFSIAGRISARRGDAGVAGAFTWTHDAAHDAIDLSTPLGQTLAKLEGGANGVEVRLPDGRTQTAATWRELTERAFGVTIPVDGMSAWVRGVPRAAEPFTIERDARGRPALLRQQGWEVVYAYADDAAERPLRASLSYPGPDTIEVRVVVDRWQ
jgi:outer membrane lipoprotein LolB